MLVRKNDATSFDIPGGTTGQLYPDHPNKEQTIATVQMDGHYPESGWSTNKICTETLFVLEGELELTVDKQTHRLQSGDLFMILPGMRYQCHGKAKVLDIITPAWEKAQNSIIAQSET